MLALMSLTPLQHVPFSIPFSFGKRKKSQGSKFSEYGGRSKLAICFETKNCFVLRACGQVHCYDIAQ